MKNLLVYIMGLFVLFSSCKKEKTNTPTPQPTPKTFDWKQTKVNGINYTSAMRIALKPTIDIEFDAAIASSSVVNAITLKQNNATINFGWALASNNQTIKIVPQHPLSPLSEIIVEVKKNLQSTTEASLKEDKQFHFKTQLDSSRKFPPISEEELLTKVQQQTFKYFWDFGHPVSGMARERNSSGDIVTTGGTGFGIMAMIVGIERSFISKEQGLNRITTIVDFLTDKAVKVKGAFSHWLNGATGAIQSFSANDNGADLVETSFLMMGLLTAREYFDGNSVLEAALRNKINALYQGVDWNGFRKNNEEVLYWHYSPDKEWIMNLPIRGWNECLITYILAAASPSHAIPANVYHNGWKTTSYFNGASYYNLPLPVGPAMGGPLFLSQYSFLGLNPMGLKEGTVDFEKQVKNHALINYHYCKDNPKNYYGYSDSLWGLTASDIPNGYTACSPTNDVGVIAPTAALSSFPFTPTQSKAALNFYYYVLGDKLWKDYGFIDAFSLDKNWFADSFLAIDQGPIIIMIENYRTGLLWNLFSHAPEIKEALRDLGFTAPYL